MSRARSEAATSSPMKLAPMTSARRAPLARVDDGAAIGERAQRMDVRQVGARDRQPHRLGAGRQQQPVVGKLLAAGERTSRVFGIDAGDFGVEPQLDVVLARRNSSGRSGTHSSGALPAR